jgi:hypothetical protein
VITYQELQVIAAVLRVSLEWLVGQEDNHDPIIWNAPADPKQAERILHLWPSMKNERARLLYGLSFYYVRS